MAAQLGRVDMGLPDAGTDLLMPAVPTEEPSPAAEAAADEADLTAWMTN